MLAVVLALAVTAVVVGVGVGASYEAAKKSGSAPAEADGTPGLHPQEGRSASATALKLVSGHWPRRGGAAYYRRITRKRVPAQGAAGFLPLYREAERVYGVNWRLLASVHRQETAFSKAPSTYRGLNDYGCCAGPMQFNVTNGPVSTWKRYRKAFREGRRPAVYPHRTKSHPSIYDDFDAIMAAGKLLSASGAGRSLDEGAWQAAYSYYGHDLYGITYASQVVARAIAWERHGFCPNCNPDDRLVAELEDAYGAAARVELVGSEPPRKAKKGRGGRDRKSKRRKAAAERRRRREAADRRKRREAAADRRRARQREAAADRRRSARRRPAPGRRPRRRPPRARPSPPPPTSTAPTAPPTTAPAPPPPVCPPIRKLLGCR